VTLRLLALDLSLSATGLASTYTHRGEPALNATTIHTRRYAPEGIDHRRIHAVYTAVKPFLDRKPHLVIIEWLPQFDGHGDATLRLAELHGVIRHYLWVNQVPVVDIRPTYLQMYATGSGRAQKTKVREEVTARFGRLVHIGDDNQADAVAMLAATLDHFGLPLAPVPDHHRRALTGVRWPDISLPTADAAFGPSAVGIPRSTT
jgi:crossover junction endodeoxyribonuclease RuvC